MLRARAIFAAFLLASSATRQAQAVWCDCEQSDEDEYSDFGGLSGVCQLGDYATDTTWISCHDMVTFPDLSAFTALEELRIENGWLTTVPDEITSLTSLKALDLSANQLTSLPQSLQKLRKLTGLRAANNLLETLPDELSSLTALRRLNIADNQFASLPNVVTTLTLLTRLVAGYNEDLTALPGSIKKLSNLVHADFEGCELESLPSAIGDLVSLTVLRVGDNSLSALPATLTGLAELRTVELWGNRLTSLPDAGLRRLSQLEYVDLEGNQLTGVPADLGRLSALKDIFLGSNQLSALPSTIGSLAQLEYLDVSSNSLQSLPSSFTGLSSLSWLHVSGNPFCGNQPDLTELSFQYVDGGEDFTECPSSCSGEPSTPSPTPTPATPSPTDAPVADLTDSPTPSPTLGDDDNWEEDCSPSDVVLMLDGSLDNFAKAQEIALAIADKFDIGTASSQDRVTAFNFERGIKASKDLRAIKNRGKLVQLINKMTSDVDWSANLPFAFSHAVSLLEKDERSASATKVIVALTQGVPSVSKPNKKFLYKICPRISNAGQATESALQTCMTTILADAVDAEQIVVIYVPMGKEAMVPEDDDDLATYLQVPEVDDLEDASAVAAAARSMVIDQCARPTAAPTWSPVVGAKSGCYEYDIEYRGAKINVPHTNKMFATGLDAAEQCHSLCQDVSSCQFWSWRGSQSKCWLFSYISAAKSRPSSREFVSGSRTCA